MVLRDQVGQAHQVVPDARIAEERRTVGSMNLRTGRDGRSRTRGAWFCACRSRTPGARPCGRRRQRFDVDERALEPRVLLVKERRLRIVCRGKVRIHRIEIEIRTGEQLGQRARKIVEPEPEPVHPGVDFEVIPHALPVPRRGRLHRTRRARRRDRRRQPAVEQAIEIADAEGAKHQNVRADPGLAQHCAFFDIGASQKVRSGLFKRAPHLPGAMTVSVGLDHRNQARHPIAPFAADMLDDAPVVRLERVQVDSGNGGTNHGVSCRLWAFGFRLCAPGAWRSSVC